MGTGRNLDMEELLKWADQITSERSPDGTKLEFREDGVFLTVYPPENGGVAWDPEQLVTDITARNIQNIEYTKVRQAAREARGMAVCIAPPQTDVKTECSVKAEISKNNMEAYITVNPMGGQVTREAIEKALQESNIIYGIREEVIERALCLTQEETLTVAHGSNPIEGENASIEFKFATGTLRGKPTETLDGRADFYNLNLIQNVEPGQVLAVKKVATPGIPGYTVTGEEIPAKPGKDVQLAVGKNVQLSEDKTVAVAAVKGHVIVTGNKISVSNIFEVPGDVDFNTGNIEFNGSVIVKGSIREGFRVTAEGDVEVMNTIADGMVECTGQIKVKNGIVGKKTKIKAGGSVFTRFIENSVVESGGEVVVGEAIMHSRVSAAKSVVVGGKGVIVGGLIRAGEDINCKVVGSPLATITELEAGINPELRREMNRLTNEKKVKQEDFDKADKAAKLLNYMQKTQGQLPADKQAILARVGRLMNQLSYELEQLDEAMRAIEFQIEQSERGRILVQGVIHSGARVTIGSAMLQIQDDYTFACLKKIGEDIKISAYK